VFARSRPETKVIVLMGGATSSRTASTSTSSRRPTIPRSESWLNLQAIDDVVREIVETDSHLVISALRATPPPGGVPFALAADRVVAREDVVLNPYYRHMGGLYWLGVLDLPAAAAASGPTSPSG
jgi:putative two-component system hydrogenase maturation factor HypX/HoxX